MFGGREATVMEELVFAQQYALADGPVRTGFFGESLLGPTLIAFGTEQQQARLLPSVTTSRFVSPAKTRCRQ
jgi:alkylation response protein AidB-like acyl-CoA dehydrogenase